MRLDSLIIMRGGECLLKVSLAGFQRTEFITNQTRITIAFGDEGQTPFDGGVDLVQVLLYVALVGTALFAQPCKLGLELGDKGVDQVFIAKQNVFV